MRHAKTLCHPPGIQARLGCEQPSQGWTVQGDITYGLSCKEQSKFGVFTQLLVFGLKLTCAPSIFRIFFLSNPDATLGQVHVPFLQGEG